MGSSSKRQTRRADEKHRPMPIDIERLRASPQHAEDGGRARPADRPRPTKCRTPSLTRSGAASESRPEAAPTAPCRGTRSPGNTMGRKDLASPGDRMLSAPLEQPVHRILDLDFPGPPRALRSAPPRRWSACSSKTPERLAAPRRVVRSGRPSRRRGPHGPQPRSPAALLPGQGGRRPLSDRRRAHRRDPRLPRARRTRLAVPSHLHPDGAGASRDAHRAGRLPRPEPDAPALLHSGEGRPARRPTRDRAPLRSRRLRRGSLLDRAAAGPRADRRLLLRRRRQRDGPALRLSSAARLGPERGAPQGVHAGGRRRRRGPGAGARVPRAHRARLPRRDDRSADADGHRSLPRRRGDRGLQAARRRVRRGEPRAPARRSASATRTGSTCSTATAATRTSRTIRSRRTASSRSAA